MLPAVPRRTWPNGFNYTPLERLLQGFYGVIFKYLRPTTLHRLAHCYTYWYMNQTSQLSPKLRFIAIFLVLLMAAAFLIGAGSLLSAGIYLMKGAGQMALSEIGRAALFFIAAYLINVLTAFIFSKRWSWRGLQFVLEKPTKSTPKK